MKDYSGMILALVGLTAVVNAFFFLRYNTLEYNIEVDTDVVIRKLKSMEEKIDTLINKQ